MLKEMNASIITIGDELLIGQVIDTNSAFIAKELNKIGIWVKRRVVVGDVYDDIWNALNEERKQAQLIIITGGLSPTADDITKPLLCKYFNTKVVRNQTVLAHILNLYNTLYKRKTPLSEQNISQADLPESCTVLHNAQGTAAGMWFEATNSDGQKIIFISLPGVPYEMKKIFLEEALPKIVENVAQHVVIHKVLSTFGAGETAIADQISEIEQQLPPHMKLAYLPGYGQVKLRLTTKGVDKNRVEKEVEKVFDSIKASLKEITISETDLPLHVIAGNLLIQYQKTLGTAESCTGGYIAHLITSVAGASAYFNGAIVSYSNAAKQNLLNVQPKTLDTFGAVSEATVAEMVQGCIQSLQTDYAIATSGIMGPGGGTDNKPVGTVWIAAANKNKVITQLLHLGFDRERNIQTTAQHALYLLRKLIMECELKQNGNTL